MGHRTSISEAKNLNETKIIKKSSSVPAEMSISIGLTRMNVVCGLERSTGTDFAVAVQA